MRRGRTIMKTAPALPFLACSALLLLWPIAGHAQPACDDALQQAQKSYDLGAFEDVATQLAPCLGIKLSRARAIEVHSLLARAYLNQEEPQKARREISTILRLDSTFEPTAFPRFAALVAEIRREEQTTQVVSVSKTSESLREAPATVVVVTSEQIHRRGYLDLEQLLHDLPGFDIARLNGAYYSSIYQRGYRNSDNDRLLLLVDGVEQNDLSGGAVYLSRQYPLTNIDRVEVVYGPASTMYGANAYTGVINIVTLDPEVLVGDKRRFGIIGQVTGGGYSNRSADITAAGTSGDASVAWTVAASFQKSRERDLTHLDPWDFTYRNVDYKDLMRLTGTPQERAALCTQPSPYILCTATGIELTDQGADLVRGLDRQQIADLHAGFDDRATNWGLNAKLRVLNLTLGLQSWSSQEGIVSAYGTPTDITGNTSWTPKATAFYVKYTVPLDRMKLNVFARYEQTSLDRKKSHFDYVHNYNSGFLNLFSLVPPCRSDLDPLPVSCAPASPWLEKESFGLLNSELRSEASLSWQPSEKLSGVGGVELAKASIQNQYDQSPSGPGYLSGTALEKPEQNEHTDLAVYAQGSWKPRKALRFVFAGRISYNSIDNKPGVSGYGTLFTPRLGVIYVPGQGRFVLKAIYSEAFKDPTDSQKFSVLRYVYEVRSNGLKPERVRNIEMSAGWEPSPHLSLEASAYQASYTNVVAFGAPRLPDGTLITDCFSGCLQFQNRERLRIRGFQATGSYKIGALNIWANYTHTSPFQINPTDLVGDPLLDAAGKPLRELPVADIARNQGTIGFEHDWNYQWSGGMRVHLVGRRPTGPGTTFDSSPFTQTDAYSTIDATVSYRGPLPNTTFQLSAFNLSNRNYYDPGNFSTLPRVLQAGRTFHLRLIYGLPMTSKGKRTP
jgi:outer membrane receptor protein involved in Fe transport